MNWYSLLPDSGLVVMLTVKWVEAVLLRYILGYRSLFCGGSLHAIGPMTVLNPWLENIYSNVFCSETWRSPCKLTTELRIYANKKGNKKWPRKSKETETIEDYCYNTNLTLISQIMKIFISKPIFTICQNKISKAFFIVSPDSEKSINY